MKKIWQQVEYYNRKLIPSAIVLLLLLIIAELFVHVEDPQLLAWIHFADAVVIAIFVVDLIFLAFQAKTATFFFRRYWLDIIAIFPFNLMFELVSRLSRLVGLGERVAVGQAIFHEGLEARKIITEEGKLSKLIRPLRIGVRVLRVVAKTRLFSRGKQLLPTRQAVHSQKKKKKVKRLRRQR